MGGAITFIGLEGKPEAHLRLDIDRFHFRKIRLIPSHNAPNSLLFPEAAEYLRRKIVDAEALVSHRFPLDAIGEAFQLAAEHRSAVVRVMIAPV